MSRSGSWPLGRTVGEAAQEWLDSKDDDDRQAVAEARDHLLATLDGSPGLVATISKLARLVGSTPTHL
ncbi:MAG TPA: hypothetical protein VKF14_20825 [Candidatus Dormibacteraeota bacterium]|nr:hypothetical protein [Candidatus Dormibacteraeota bacterium]